MIIIDNLVKPKDCRSCQFNRDDCYCTLNKGCIDRDDYTNNRGCPMISVSDNATNGDVIKALFPNTAFTDRKFAIEWKDNDGLISVFGDTDWWNAPYPQK